MLSAAAREVFGDVETVSIPLADGGEGTVEAVVAATGGTLRTALVRGPRGKAVEATYGILGSGDAIIEMAAASGLPLLHTNERDPLVTSTYGTGELILHAIDEGARSITLAIGGSATNDGGMGCMRALGARFLDEHDNELEGVGGDLVRVAHIDLAGMDKRLARTSFVVMCDVDNPLLGERGATRVFGPQKGADPTMVNELEQGMASYAHVLSQYFDGFDPTASGMGAAGGLGAAARAFLNAKLQPGIERVLDLVGFDDLLQDCDLCVTGEGHADEQSAHGKVISGIAQRCVRAGVPCVAIVGGMDAEACELLNVGVSALVPAVIDACTVEEALANAERNYMLAAQRVFSLLKIPAAWA
ncbi:MAG: glycerate kinase [Atopobiaceae bacterium]|nr:glycerate kinase [Atopobiaceae bacterium]